MSDTVNTLKKVEALCRHIEEVQRNCRLLGTRLIERGNEALGLQLIANGMKHDGSKWTGLEWEHLFDEDGSALEAAIRQHSLTNRHHPESWPGGIKDMPQVYLAEAVCDWVSRASEFGTDVREWVDKTATKRYGFTKHTKVYREIQGYLNLLLERPFS